MKNKILSILYLFVIIGILASCNKEDEIGKSIINLEDIKQNDTDKWIFENLTKPYNIEVKYKWDATELEMDKVLNPPRLEDVVPFLEVLKKTWIDPYVLHGGATFVKKLIPKQIILVGSENINGDGTVTQGTAEGGRKVVLYELNSFDSSDITKLKRMLHVMHHEFGHILHQNVLYPDEFKMITPGGYTSDWANTKWYEAYEQAFVTPYAKNIVDDDFVEMIATILTNSSEEWAKIKKKIIVWKREDDGSFSETPDGYNVPLVDETLAMREKFSAKERIVVNYFLSVYGIKIFDLQKSINDSMLEVVNN